MKTKTRDFEGEILALGWDCESKSGASGAFGRSPYLCQASQGSFKTPWLDSWEAVLAWILKGRKEAA